MGSGCSTLDSVTKKLTDLAFELALKHLIYIAKVTENVWSLSTEMDRLQRLQAVIVNRITREERDGTRKETPVVQGWRSEVDECKVQVDKIKDDYAQRGCRIVSCGCGSSTTEGGGGGAGGETIGGGGSYCSFNCWSNYCTGKAAAKMIVRVKELLDKGRDLGDVTEEQLPPPAQTVHTERLVLGVESNLEKAMRYLKDECDHGILGIWGTGGVGKSTLLAEINNSLAAKVNIDAAIGGFQHVIPVVASHGCTPEKIQNQILEKLHLPNENYVDVGERAAAIANYLMNKNFVLLLDDLWEPLDLVQIGIPRPPRHCRHHAGQEDDSNSKMKRWKVILVSRSRAVCSQMGANNENDMIYVEGLKGEDAWRLFEEKVGTTTIGSHPRIRGIAEKIVKECDGLPLALVVIGRYLSSKHAPGSWDDALETLQNSQQISGTEEKLFTCLKLSYDNLENDRIRECYLCCSLWPEDAEILKEDLIQCWLGHGLINNFNNISQAFNKGHSIIESLQEASLLEATKVASYVKMHDVLRDMALWIACDCGASTSKWIVRAGLGLTEAPEEERLWTEATKISLMVTKIEEVPSTITTSCPNVTTLILSKTSVGEGLNRLHYFHNLKYLDLSDCGNYTGFPMEICGMVNLEYLNLSHNPTPSIPEDVIHLQNLKYLILENTGVSSVPGKMISNLPQLLVLQLRSHFECNHDSVIDQLDDGIIKAVHLRGLGITVSSVSSFPKLTSSRTPIYDLSLQKMETETSLPLLSPKLLGMPNIRHHLKKLHIAHCSEDLEEVLIQGDESLEFVESLGLFGLPGLKRIIVKEVACKALFPTLAHLVIGKCDGLKHVSWILHLPYLSLLMIFDCKNMNKVIDEKVASTGDEEEEEEETRPSPFSKLEYIFLDDLPSLTCICSSTFAFPLLRTLLLNGCPELRKLPFKSGNCAKMEMISGHKSWWEGLDWEKPDDGILFKPLFVERERLMGEIYEK